MKLTFKIYSIMIILILLIGLLTFIYNPDYYLYPSNHVYEEKGIITNIIYDNTSYHEQANLIVNNTSFYIDGYETVGNGDNLGYNYYVWQNITKAYIGENITVWYRYFMQQKLVAEIIL